MEKIIKIDLHDKYDLVNKYDEKKISQELLQYILKQATLAQKYEKIKIVINKKFYMEKDSIAIIKEGLKEEYARSLKERDANNVRQLLFFVLGLIIIFFSTLVPESGIWKEILVISGWVPIWEMVEMELFPDAAGRRERKTIDRILNGEILETSEIVDTSEISE